MISADISQIIDEFRNLLRENKYITFKEYEQFLEKYSDSISENHTENISNTAKEIINNGYSYIEKHNDKFIDNKLLAEKDYFDDMFKNIDNSIKLDDEQRKAILNEEDYSLIIAGAGAGKTTTMAAKVKYLIERLKIEPSKIVVISYTNKATDELEDRIKYEFNLPVDIMTFHSLGLKIIKRMFKHVLKPASDNEQNEIICSYVKDILFNNKNSLTEYINTFNKYDYDGNKMFARGFTENYHKFTTFEEYFTNYKMRKKEQNKDNIPNIIAYRTENYLNQANPKSLKNETMRSKAEAIIANFLFINGIDYKYEQPYPEKVEEEKTYLPDFTIEVDGIPLYIEYFGLSSLYENGTISQKNLNKYKDIREKKKSFHDIKKNNYIELDYKITKEGSNINYLEELKNKLLQFNVKFNKKTDLEIYEQILNNNIQAEFFNFVNFGRELINKIKSNPNRENIKEVIKNYILTSTMNENQKKEMIKESNLIIKLYNYYNQELTKRNQIDFADMIYYANKYMDSLEYSNLLNYDYLIIDEYQDISLDRYEFAKNIAKLSNSKVISVGDDWQTIFSFAGSRIDLFYNYSNRFPGSKQLFINNTYRNSQQLIDKAGKFIMKNPIQIKKYLNSFKFNHNPIKICYYDYDYDQYQLVENIIGNIATKNPHDKVMILARKNKNIKKLTDSPLFSKGIDTRIICNKYPDLHIEAMSVHKAKGLGADHVIILNITNSNFPCEEKECMWLLNLFKLEEYNENYPYAEDRRIFYVALTRTKNEVYLLTPSNIENQSPFIEELKNIL